MIGPKKLHSAGKLKPAPPVIGVFATCDPRIDSASRRRAGNIVKMTAETISGGVKLPDGAAVEVVWTPVLVDGEKEADIAAKQLRQAGADILVCAPDTWAFPQLGLISLIQQFPDGTPLNITCGNSGPRPGVVFTHAASGAISQYGRLVHINVGNWPDTGSSPAMSSKTAENLIDWCYGALADRALKGRRVVIFGHDSMGMETALAHIIPARQTFGLEITRLDMKLLSDMLAKEAYDKKELKRLRNWLDENAGGRLDAKTKGDSERLDKSLALYLITNSIINDLNAVGGGFMSQLEWGSDKRGVPLPTADIMESLFNSTFDHKGRKPPIPFATEADTQGLITMLYFTYLTAGNPPLFMDFRKVWEPWEINTLARKLKIEGLKGDTLWEQKGFVDGDNSGSASFDWAELPGAGIKKIMSKISFPQADPDYFPGLGNSITFNSPGGIEGIAGRISYSSLSGMFSLVWDEAVTVDLPEKLAEVVCKTSTETWPHTFVVPKYAEMAEYKQYTPANHFHMTWGLKPARLQYWMDIANVLSSTPWKNRPPFIEGTDRPLPLLYVINGGETQAKIMLKK
jgi:L-fucose/D-arabinose isomerase